MQLIITLLDSVLLSSCFTSSSQFQMSLFIDRVIWRVTSLSKILSFLFLANGMRCSFKYLNSSNAAFCSICSMFTPIYSLIYSSHTCSGNDAYLLSPVISTRNSRSCVCNFSSVMAANVSLCSFGGQSTSQKIIAFPS